MSCKDCEARRKMAREALYKAKVGTAATHLAKGAAELTGLKKKTAVKELSDPAKKKPRAKRKPTKSKSTPRDRAGE